MRLGSIVLLLVCGVSANACLEKVPVEPKRIEEIRPYPPAFKSTTYTIQRRDFQAQLAHRVENNIRLVPVFQSAVSPDSHVYRVFDIKPKGIYGLIGIQNSDIVVAADGYLIKRPEQFAAYIELLQNEDNATIEIQRSGEAILLKYAFIPALRAPATQGTPQPSGTPGNAEGVKKAVQVF